MEDAPLSIFTRLAAQVPAFNGMSYRLLAQVNEQWPIVGRGDLYFGGTSYENKQGLGVQLALPAQSPVLAWPEIPELSISDDAILAVPIHRLYDLGQTMLSSQFLLKGRTPPAYIAVHPDTAGGLNIPDGELVSIAFSDTQVKAILYIREFVPRGIALIPRSLGMPISSPMPTKIRMLEGVQT
jgi:NADH-quinone oxidoreductase subunit G